jgi:superoxide dismutase
MELHHSKHHQAYVTNLNAALKTYSTATSSNDIAGQIALQSAIKFNGGGHINHSLFWENLTPSSSPDSKPSSAPTLSAEISKTWGSIEAFQEAFKKTLLGLQGSGWGWLVKDAQGLRIVTTKDQDPVVGGEVPVLGVDMWEHAYYLQVSGTVSPRLRVTANIGDSISTAKQHMSITSGMSSTGRRPRLVSLVPGRMHSRFSELPFRPTAHTETGTCLCAS